jgi:hypothetical protein
MRRIDRNFRCGKQGRSRDGEARVLHVMGGVGRIVAAQCAKEGEDVLTNHLEHFARLLVLETRPAELVVGEALGILALGKDAALDWLFQAGGFELFQGVELVQGGAGREDR